MKQRQLRKELPLPHPLPNLTSLCKTSPGLKRAFEKAAPTAGSPNSTGTAQSRKPGGPAGIIGESSPTLKVFRKGSKTPEQEDAFQEDRSPVTLGVSLEE